MQFNPNHRGNVAELKIAAAAAELGVPVLAPMTEHERYDLVFEIGDRLLRVQCKSASRKGEVVVVRLVTNRRGPNGFIRGRYTDDEIDAVAIYCPDLDECYLLTMEYINGLSGLHLRLTAPRNGQRAGLHYAADHRLSGAIAQLGERLRGTQEGAGSSPASSTPGFAVGADQEVGANKFRRLFGWYLERAAAGESFLVTRRGKPYVRLGPATEPLTVIPLPEKKAA
jgi:prevent-host-death family protein